MGLEGQVVDADQARARAAQRQQAAGRVDQVRGVARQAPRPAHLLPQHLGPQAAHLLADVIDAEAPQRGDQLARVAPAAARPLGAGLARIDGDGRRHAARRRSASPAASASPAWTTAASAPRTTALPERARRGVVEGGGQPGDGRQHGREVVERHREHGVGDDDHERRGRPARGGRHGQQPERDAQRGARQVRERRRREIGERRRAVEEPEDRGKGDVDGGEHGSHAGEGEHAPEQGAPAARPPPPSPPAAGSAARRTRRPPPSTPPRGTASAR